MSIQQNFPAISPSLSLNFARSKTLDPRITFSRTSTATRVNEQGLVEVVSADIPRFDHSYDPVSGTVRSLGLLIEESRTNLVTHSTTDFNYSIAGQSIATANDVAPDGNTVLCKHDLTGPTSPFLNCNVDTTLTAGTYTMSMWLKGTTSYSASFAFVGETTNEIHVNTANITTTWQRFTLTFTLINTQNNSRLQLFFATQGKNKVISIWGAQLEVGAFVTSYIPRPVAGQQAIRTADNVSMVGENFSSWYNPSEGTVFVDCTPVYNNSTNQYRRLLSIHNNSGAQTDVIQFIQTEQSNQVSCAVWDESSFQSGFGKVVTSGTRHKVAFAVKENNMNASYDGSISTDDTTCTLPVMTEMDIGNYDTFSSAQATMHINKISYYPRRLTNSQLITLTR